MAPHPPPELMDDLIGEILLRLPPEDPTCLIRASLVCKPWQRLFIDDAFLRQYHAFHQTPPVLGFFQDQYRKSTSVPHYVSIVQVSPVPQPTITMASGHTTSCCTLDCCHGRVLFHVVDQPSHTIIVWDPITGNQKCISPPVHRYVEFSAAVLCASDGCDHLRCSAGPFLVVFVGIYHAEEEDEDDDGEADGGPVAWASLYSSEIGMWSVSTSINVDSYINYVMPSLLVRDAIYIILEDGEKILKYGLVGGVLSVINAPPQRELNMILTTVQDGELGAATVEFYNLHLWSLRVIDPGRVRCRVIELDVMIPISIGEPMTMFDLAGFVEGTGSIFISANDDIFTVEIKSGQITKTGKRTSGSPIFPFMSFYTPELVAARLQGPMRTD